MNVTYEWDETATNPFAAVGDKKHYTLSRCEYSADRIVYTETCEATHQNSLSDELIPEGKDEYRVDLKKIIVTCDRSGEPVKMHIERFRYENGKAKHGRPEVSDVSFSKKGEGSWLQDLLNASARSRAKHLTYLFEQKAAQLQPTEFEMHK